DGDARPARHGADEAGVDAAAISSAAVACAGVGVVPALARLDHALPAQRVQDEGAARRRAGPAGFDLAEGAAAVARRLVVVIAAFPRIFESVTAERRRVPGRPADRAAGPACGPRRPAGARVRTTGACG